VPTGFAAHSLRRPIVLIAVWLVVLQAFLVGLATARSGAMLASDPIGAICHGFPGASPGANPSDTPDPDAAQAWHLCCASCLFAVSAIAPPPAPTLPAPRRDARALALSPFTIILERGARRAGPSQAPPTPA
jgi:DUF2946 family protein